MDAQRKPILVVGDVMLDRWISGSASRISPEAPVPIVNVAEITECPGGAANVAANIRAMGWPVWLLGAVGEDAERKALERVVQADVHRLVVVPGARTAVKTRITVDGQQLLRVDEGHGGLTTSLVADAVQEVCEQVAMIVVADYCKGVCSPAVRDVVTACMDRGVPVFLDSKGVLAWQRATLVKLNYREAMDAVTTLEAVHPALAGDFSPVDQMETATRVLCDIGFATAVVTLGARGAVYRVGEGPQAFGVAESAPQRVYDATGAGDTFMASLAVAYLEGLDLPQAVVRANVAAGLAVAEPGTAVVSRDAIDEASYQQTGWAAKLMSLEAACAFVARRRRMQQRIVMANGCFDLLHPGHIELLRWAKRQGETLVVAFNDDASVRALKGAGRPIVPESYRGAQLAQLDCVDCVVRFSDTDVTNTVKQFRPDVLVKSEEYRSQRIPGADFVASYGGDVRFAPLFGGYSTSSIQVQLDGGSNGQADAADEGVGEAAGPIK